MSPPPVIDSSRWCGDCEVAKRQLAAGGREVAEIVVDGAPQQHRGGPGTAPQSLIGGHPVGGCTELLTLQRSGELARLLEPAGRGAHTTG